MNIWSLGTLLIVLFAINVECQVSSKIFLRITEIHEHFKFQRKFSIDHVNDTFLMDGKPFQYVAGSFHYFRSVPETWQRKLRLMRKAGLNAVDM